MTTIDQGSSWKACRNSTVSDSDGITYALQLPGYAQWTKAADWGDTDNDGTIEGSINPFTGSVTILSVEAGGGDGTTIRCHTDNNPAGFMVSNTSGAGSTSNCRSRYGVADMVGNGLEWTNGRGNNYSGMDNGLDGLWHGRTLVGGWLILVENASGGAIDLLRGAVTASGTGPVIFGTLDHYYVGSGNMGSIRGGHYYYGSGAGRWLMDMSRAPTNTGEIIARCSL